LVLTALWNFSLCCVTNWQRCFGKFGGGSSTNTAIGSENTMEQLRAAVCLSVGSSATKECVILMPLEA